MRVYLDNCVFNRPFDDQASERVRLETIATLKILQEILDGNIELIWSYVNETENRRNPFVENKKSILLWKQKASEIIIESQKLLENGEKLIELGLGIGDALHLASAVDGKADLFVTTDDRMIRKIAEFEGVLIINPINAVEKLDEYIN